MARLSLVNRSKGCDLCRLQSQGVLGAAWVSVLPGLEKHNRMGKVDYQVLIRWWLCMEVFPSLTEAQKFCPLCQMAVLDSNGDHAVVCTKGWAMARHREAQLTVAQLLH